VGRKVCIYEQELNQYNRLSSIQNAYKNIKHDKFRSFILRQKGDVFNSLKAFFTKENNTKRWNENIEK
jgi:uncharacterized protein